MSDHAGQRVLIQFDTEPQRYAYTPKIHRVTKFGVATSVPCCSQPILLAQKCHAILQRPRNKGRDFYDVLFLLSRGIAPDPGYMQQRIGVDGSGALAERLIAHCGTLDMREQAEDVRQFVLNAETLEDMVHFPEIIRQHWSRG